MPIKTRDGTYNLSKEEQEVAIIYNRAQPGATIWSRDPVTNRKLDALCAEHPDIYQRIPDPDGIEDDQRKYWVADRKLIRIGKPASEARREAMRKVAQERFGQNRF